jgi:hypothetical protein
VPSPAVADSRGGESPTERAAPRGSSSSRRRLPQRPLARRRPGAPPSGSRGHGRWCSRLDGARSALRRQGARPHPACSGVREPGRRRPRSCRVRRRGRTCATRPQSTDSAVELATSPENDRGSSAEPPSIRRGCGRVAGHLRSLPDTVRPNIPRESRGSSVGHVDLRGVAGPLLTRGRALTSLVVLGPLHPRRLRPRRDRVADERARRGRTRTPSTRPRSCSGR